MSIEGYATLRRSAVDARSTTIGPCGRLGQSHPMVQASSKIEIVRRSKKRYSGRVPEGSGDQAHSSNVT
jgi:hypothetical protein